MTYKSKDPIIDAEGAGRIVRFLPAMDADESDRRDLFMLRPLYDWCYQGVDPRALDFKRNIRAFLGRYVKGGEIVNGEYMKNWARDVFEIRVQLQKKTDNTRIFGAFVRPDVFIATHQRPRSHFGDKTDRRWNVALSEAVAGIAWALPGTPLIRANPFSNCLTFGFVDP